jgi:hypothetical protein
VKPSAFCFSSALLRGLPACLEGGHQGTLDAPNADLVEVHPVAVAGFQGFDEQVIQRDSLEQGFEGLGDLGGLACSWASPCGVVDGDGIQALFDREAKRFLARLRRFICGLP